jgi:CheY-like chemotaxis protein
VEDDELNCLVMKTSLKAGFGAAGGTNVEVTIVHTAEDALKVIGDAAGIAFDVVVSDQHMDMVGGVLKGSELIERLVARNFAVRPVLAIASANTDEHETAAYLASGADIVWPKPYPRHALLVNDILQHWKRIKSGAAARVEEREGASANRKNSSKVVPMA